MKKFTIFLLLVMSIFLSVTNIFSQNISGRLVNQFEAGIPNADLKLYISPNEYNTTSDLDGSFSFSDLTSVDEEILPNGYGVSNNFPNPFNPVTRIMITLPKSSNVKVSVYNVIGQMVYDRPAETLSAGTKQIDLKLDGLSNGIYLARITIDNKYTVMRKLSLVYGSQHLYQAGSGSSSYLPKSSNTNSLVNIDSLVVKGTNVVKTTFTNLPSYTGGTLELGTLTVNIEVCPETVTHSGKTYNTVQIGTQCWLKENLDIGTMIESNSGGFLQTDNEVIEKYCYANNPANCEQYGGLYEWPEAMQYVTTQGAQGICPEGWHIPTLAEFEELQAYVGDEAKKLIAVGETGSATNESGFSALLAGYRRSSSGDFNLLGHSTYFLSSSGINGSSASNMSLNYDFGNVTLTNFSKEYGFSVRCVNGEGNVGNTPPSQPSNPTPADNTVNVSVTTNLGWVCTDPDGDNLTYSVYFGTDPTPDWGELVTSSHTGTSFNLITLEEETTYYWKIVANDGNGGETEGAVWSFTTVAGNEPCPGIPTVIYGGKVYNTVQIGAQCWLKENLDIGTMIESNSGGFLQTDNEVIEKYCYANNPANCEQYGGLYEWPEAMQYVTTQGAQGICPEGWHIPTLAEFEELQVYVGYEAKKLIAVGETGNATNGTGFSALLAGNRHYYDGAFYSLGYSTSFWSSFENNGNGPYDMILNYNNSSVRLAANYKESGVSVRCLKD